MKPRRLTLDEAMQAYRAATKGFRQQALARLRETATAELRRNVRNVRDRRRKVAA